MCQTLTERGLSTYSALLMRKRALTMSDVVHIAPRARVTGKDAAPRAVAEFEKCIRAVAMAEAAAVILASVVAKVLYIDLILAQTQSTWLYVAPAPLLALTLYLFLKQERLYDSAALLEPKSGYGKLLGALAMSMLVLLGILYACKTAEFYSRAWIFTWFALSAISLITVRVIAMRCIRTMVAKGRLRLRIAVFGIPEFVTAMKAQIESSAPSLDVSGLYLSKLAVQDATGPSPQSDLDELRRAVGQRAFDTVIIGLPASETEAIRAAVSALSSFSTELLLCTELEPFPVAVNGTQSFGTLRTNVVNRVPISESNRLIKSVLDYAVAVVGLTLLAPLLAVIAVGIKLDSPGPVFFLQRRYGQNNWIFRIIKFRTMTVAEDGPIVRQAQRGDPRVTRVGHFLRRLSLDELPQLINVLKGDMSIVGPRPHALAHDELFERDLYLFSRRRRVRPGLTGWAQVQGYRGETTTAEDVRGRMQKDLFYIDNWSIWFDMEIIARTVFVVFRGAY